MEHYDADSDDNEFVKLITSHFKEIMSYDAGVLLEMQ